MLAFFGLISAFLNVNMDFRIWGGQNLGNLTSKHIKPNVFKNYCTGKCLKSEQFLKAEHLLKHVFPYPDRSFYGPGR